jgi:hypothetical protein
MFSAPPVLMQVVTEVSTMLYAITCIPMMGFLLWVANDVYEAWREAFPGR